MQGTATASPSYLLSFFWAKIRSSLLELVHSVSMASDHVLRLPRTDSPSDYVLLNASRNGSNPLDLKLLATEGTEPYIKLCRPSIVVMSYLRSY